MMINLVELLMYLYYNKEKDIIYHSDSPHSDEILFCSYEENGWKQSDEISIADSGFTFRILSNFGYGSKSYFHFVAKYKDCLLLLEYYSFSSLNHSFIPAPQMKLYLNIEV